jgi:DNA polymerase-3 subunit epsilon
VDVNPVAGVVPHVALGPRSSMLTDRALSYLGRGPADAASVVREVCQIPAVRSRLADHLAVALLGGDARFLRRLDGRWELAPDKVDIRIERFIDGLTYVVVDVETTGTRVRDGDRITEIAVVQVRDGRATTVFESLINPERPIPPVISALTNISSDMVRGAPRFVDVAEELAGVLEGRIFVAHNAAFDWRFISTEMQRATGRPILGTRLCTVRMARRLLPMLRRRSLDSITAFFGITITARHRAGGDAVATAEVLKRLLGAARDAGISTFDELQAHLRSPKRVRRRLSALPQAVMDDLTA